MDKGKVEIARNKGEFISTDSYLRRRRKAPSSISCIETLSFLFSLPRAARELESATRIDLLEAVLRHFRDEDRAARHIIFRQRRHFRRALFHTLALFYYSFI